MDSANDQNQVMEEKIKSAFGLWSEHPYFDELTRKELQELTDPKELEDRFYTDLEFGTGGLRGIIGAGTNRMNKYVIRKVTQGLADYLIRSGRKGEVVIAHDSRHFSREFSLEAALILAANGIKAYLFDDLRPTPLLSFAVRYLKADAGIIVTASHNPKEYNGYKLYNEYGEQIMPDLADQLLSIIRDRQEWVDIVPMDQAEAVASGLLAPLGDEVDRAYLQEVTGLALYPDLIRSWGHELKIVYTPLHGAGNVLVRKVLADLGFSHVQVVKEQERPDPDFTTVPYPNPEIPTTFALAQKLGEETGADLILATDPDSDRLGVMVRDSSGRLTYLTGNEMGVLLNYYILTQKRALGILPEKAFVIKTIASTDMVDDLCHSLGVRVESVLTGFKFIAAREREVEEGEGGEYQFGFEESIGYRAGTFVRDKDGIIAAALVSEAALYYRIREGKTLPDVLKELYGQIGYYGEDTVSMGFEGREGKEKMDSIMETLRHTDLPLLGPLAVEKIDDYELRQGRNLETGLTYALTLPRSNVLRYGLKGGGFVMARPSGTEPKIKFYFCIKGATYETMSANLQQVKEDFLGRIKRLL